MNNTILVLVCAALLTAGCGKQSEKCELPCVDDKTTTESIYEHWGISDAVVRLTAGDYMLDMRYRVKDIEKSKPLFDRKIFPVMIRESDGSRFMVPASEKLGVIRQAPRFVKVDKQYFMFFANPGKRIKRGETVTVLIGDFKLPHIKVE